MRNFRVKFKIEQLRNEIRHFWDIMELMNLKFLENYDIDKYNIFGILWNWKIGSFWNIWNWSLKFLEFSKLKLKFF